MVHGEEDIKQLKAHWYQKLKEEGFKDAETPNGYLKDHPVERLKRDYTPEKFNEKQNYFRLAAQFYHDHTFDSFHEQKVWQLHAEGLSLREMATQLRTKENHINKDGLQKIVSKFSRIIRGLMLEEE